MNKTIKNPLRLSLLALFLLPFFVLAQSATESNNVEISISPRSGSFVEDTLFEVPILINTNLASISKLSLKINFDRDILSIVKPSGGRSIVGFWEEPPRYDNAKGTITYTGSIPEGIVTESGLIATITFKALGPGHATISVDSASKIFLNDGLETEARTGLGRAEYDILKKPVEGINVFSETHPFPGRWYNNDTPVISWQREGAVTGFSFILDDKPFTIPDNVVDTEETTHSYENLTDGVWYFHVKGMKGGAWGTTSHFVIKIDTVPPAEFTPTSSNFTASAILAGRTFVSFFTTDNLSGVNHFEVGVVDKNQPITEAPVLVEAGSPYQIPIGDDSVLKVIVRAIDKAGNTRDGFVEVAAPNLALKLIRGNTTLLVGILAVFILIVYYLLRRRFRSLVLEEVKKEIDHDIKEISIK